MDSDFSVFDLYELYLVDCLENRIWVLEILMFCDYFQHFLVNNKVAFASLMVLEIFTTFASWTAQKP